MRNKECVGSGPNDAESSKAIRLFVTKEPRTTEDSLRSNLGSIPDSAKGPQYQRRTRSARSHEI
jgi:hypothetical protein